MTEAAISDIIRTIDEARVSQKRISSKQISDWMRSSLPDVRALAFAVLSGNGSIVESPPSAEVSSFFLHHLLEAMVKNQPTTNYPNRYTAAHSLRAWFQRLWAVNPHDPWLRQIRDDLAVLVRGTDVSVRDSVITGVLEHLFANAEIRSFFFGWDNSPGLTEAYQEALRMASGFR